MHRFPQPGSFREGVGIDLSYPYESRGRDSFKGGRFVTPRKLGYRFLCCYSFRPFLPGNFSPGYRLTTGKIQTMSGLATSSPTLVASHDPFSPAICPGICENVATFGAMCCISTKFHLPPVNGIKSRKIPRHLQRLCKLVEMILVIPLTPPGDIGID